ncbi:MAG: DUF4111 domain-containing protein [Candidatus Eremiobacteraeota bacterium]|nr:DUF4111 domain-containing protein [Candidatus Eremiobacteraeota bacterium]
MIRGQDIASADLDIRKYVIRIAAEVGEVLSDRLAGLYLHGSLATGSFFRHASDIDVLILVDGPLPAATLGALDRKLHELDRSRPSKGVLEVSVVQAAHARRYEHPIQVELQLNSSPAAVPAQLLHVRQRSLRVTGDEPAHAVGAIPWFAFMDSVRHEFEAKAQQIETRPVSVIFNACRTLHDATVSSVEILSKIEAAEWARNVVPQECVALIDDALEVYVKNASRNFDRSAIERLRQFVAGRAAPAFEKVRDTGEDDE